MTAGTYKGRHYTEWVDTVKQLKREGRDDDAAALLNNLVLSVEREGRVEMLPLPRWYYEQLAILHRKRKDYAAEIGILERFQQHPLHVGHENATVYASRIAKARELLASSTPESSGDVVPLTPAIHESIINRGVARRLFEMGASAADVGRSIDNVTARQGGVPPTGEALFLEVASLLQRQALAEGDFLKGAGIHRHHAYFLAESGLDWVGQARLSVLAMLRVAGEAGLPPSATMIVRSQCGCSACSATAGAWLTFDQALESDVVPHAGCAAPPCPCIYLPVAQR